MKIIIDTREQKPLKFPGHEVIYKKLDEGDYNVEELIPYIVFERKSLQDLYGSIVQDHARFKKEILRAKDKGKIFYIFIEGTLEEFYYFKWATRLYEMKPNVLSKIINTMIERYSLIIVECDGRVDMSKKILSTIKEQKLVYGQIIETESE